MSKRRDGANRSNEKMNFCCVKAFAFGFGSFFCCAALIVLIPACIIGIASVWKSFQVTAERGCLVGYNFTEVGWYEYSWYKYLADNERLFVDVDPPHPALRMIHEPHEKNKTTKKATANMSGIKVEPQRCMKASNVSWMVDKQLDAWTTTNVSDVAVLLVDPERSDSDELLSKSYNGSNFDWFKRFARSAAKGANVHATIASYVGYYFHADVFVCNPLNRSALFNVVVVGYTRKYMTSNEGTEWIGQKSISLVPSNTLTETVMAQFEFDEPVNETLTAEVRISARGRGGLALIIADIVSAGVALVLLVPALWAQCAPRSFLRLFCSGNINNWQNIPDGKLDEATI